MTAAEPRAVRALLFDLDDTLIHEVASRDAALRATGESARERHGIDPAELGRAVRRRARESWLAHPLHPYAERIGISSWEALWARFDGDTAEIAAFRRWAPAYRSEAWSRGLEDLGVRDPALAELLAVRFPAERRARHRLFPETVRVLSALRRRAGYRMALITNGLSCLQREKIAGGGLQPWFDVVTIAGEVGAAKPDLLPFRLTLEALGCAPGEAWMIGNNPEKDIDGARRAGIRPIWLDRHASTETVDAGARIASLDELSALLGP